jgi:hypothetical protein
MELIVHTGATLENLLLLSPLLLLPLFLAAGWQGGARTYLSDYLILLVNLF